VSTCESILDELAAWGSRTTEPAADTFQRYEMDETAPSAAQGTLDIRSAPAAPTPAPGTAQPPADPRPLVGVGSSCRPASASSAQQEVAKQVAVLNFSTEPTLVDAVAPQLGWLVERGRWCRGRLPGRPSRRRSLPARPGLGPQDVRRAVVSAAQRQRPQASERSGQLGGPIPKVLACATFLGCQAFSPPQVW
jgi:hypothetical protein